jgi:hypothetical protein
MLIQIFQTCLLISTIVGMLPEEKAQLRLQVIDMFKHGFGSYMVGNMNMCFAEICLSC